MTTWKEFSQQNPQMADFGKGRFQNGVAYLGTIRADGGPRVHPVTPIIGDHLFLFMEPTSPKGKDLQRDSRYSLHCSVENSGGGEGEFYVRGQASFIDDPKLREEAIKASSYAPADRYVLFMFSIDFAFMNTYINGKADMHRWQAGE